MQDNEGQWRTMKEMNLIWKAGVWGLLEWTREKQRLFKFKCFWAQLLPIKGGEREREIIKQCPNIEQIDPENIQIKCLETWCIRYISDKMWSVSKSSFFIQLIYSTYSSKSSHLPCRYVCLAPYRWAASPRPSPSGTDGQMSHWKHPLSHLTISHKTSWLIGIPLLGHNP